MSIAAELHGKTPFPFSEDLLTSDVFTCFRYLPADRGMIGFLRTIEGLDQMIPAPDSSSTCRIYFWPQGPVREPDVLLELQIRGHHYHVVVEAKYMSGPSDYELEDGESLESAPLFGIQLAEEFQDLLGGQYWEKVSRWARRSLPLESAPGDRALLYLTAHLTRPEEEFQKILAGLPHASGKLFWANWYHLYDYFAEGTENWDQEPHRSIVHDLLALLKQKGFFPFCGFPEMPAIRPGALPWYRWLDEETGGA